MIKFLKFLLGVPPDMNIHPIENGRLLMNANGNIRLNTDNPDVRKGIHQEMMKYKDM